MKVQILCFGKLDEKFFQAASAEYCKRLERYCDLKITELKEEFRFEWIRNQMVNSELLIQHLQNFKDYQICLLDVGGQMVNSEKFAQLLEENKNRESGKICFVIGPSDGYSAELKQAYQGYSFGSITLPHQLFRIVLLEQIYRSFKMINHEKYHK